MAGLGLGSWATAPKYSEKNATCYRRTAALQHTRLGVQRDTIGAEGALSMSERSDSLGGVLTGIRVLDFGRYIAGPYCAALLADLGADVIRIERAAAARTAGWRRSADDGVGAMFLVMNRNKRAMTLDPCLPRGARDRPEARGDRRRRRGQPAARGAALARRSISTACAA